MDEGSGAHEGPPIEVVIEELAQRLNRKLTFEEAVSKLTDMVEREYASASPPTKEKIFALVCRVEKLLRNRYTVRGFWMAGRRLFEIMEAVTESAGEKQQARRFAQKAQEFLGEAGAMEERQADRASTSSSSSSSLAAHGRPQPFLFEGQLSQPEPSATPVLASLSAMGGGGGMESETLIAALAWFVAENTPPSDVAFSVGEQPGGQPSQEGHQVGRMGERRAAADGNSDQRGGDDQESTTTPLCDRNRIEGGGGQSDNMVVDRAPETLGAMSVEELDLRDGDDGTSVMDEQRELVQVHVAAEEGDSDALRENGQGGAVGGRASFVLVLSAERMEDVQEHVQVHQAGVDMDRDSEREGMESGRREEERGGGGGGAGGGERESSAGDDIGSGEVDDSSDEGDEGEERGGEQEGGGERVQETESDRLPTSSAEEREAVREEYRRLFLERARGNAEDAHAAGDGDFGAGYIPALLRLLREGLMRISSDDLEDVLRQTIIEAEAMETGPPPASKEEVEKLPVLELTEEMKKNLAEPECPVCREDFVVGDSIRYMPCKHYFHPACLQPWLDKHNSCPICRFEMRTDDEDYERRKEREKQAQEERRGVENALPEPEFMYM